MYIEKVVISKDPDGISSSIKPKWLVTLLDKYKNSNNTNNTNTTNTNNNTNAAASDSATDAAVVVTPPSVTVGKFCRNLIVDRNSTNGTNGNGANWDEDTSAAIEELLQASSDNITLFGSSSSSIANITVGSSNTTNPTPNNAATATTATTATTTATNPHALYSQPYYARRLFNFISKLNEMKSIPKDEKSL